MAVKKKLKKRPSPASLPELQRLVKVVARLRKECPWDRKQTHKTLTRYLVEEAFEAVDAIDSGKDDLIREELGDVLLQVVLHSEVAKGRGKFTIEDVAKGISDKMVRRHPHVFQKNKTLDLKNHSRNWTRLKSQEKPKRFLLEGIPRGMPSLQLAQRYGEIAASVGFDWKTPAEVLKKVDEELKELRKEIGRRRIDKKAMTLELGDLLFALTSLARHLKIDAEGALRAGSSKFSDRFSRLETLVRGEGKTLAELSAKELDAAWERIKQQGL